MSSGDPGAGVDGGGLAGRTVGFAAGFTAGFTTGTLRGVPARVRLGGVRQVFDGGAPTVLISVGVGRATGADGGTEDAASALRPDSSRKLPTRSS